MTTKSRTDLSVTTMAPSEIRAILLADGWHEIADCEFTQFAISPAASPPQPNKVYSAVRYQDQSNGKTVVTPLAQVLGFESNS